MEPGGVTGVRADPAVTSSADAGGGGASRLRRDIGAGQFFTLAFGAIIGVGWVVVLGEWLGQAGPVGAIAAFAAGAVLMMLIGLCYAEVVTMLPVAGGEVAYTYEVFGPTAAYAIGWLLALAYIAVTAFEAISVGWVLATLVPGVEGPVLYTSLGDPVRAGSLALGVGGMVLLTWLNYRGGGSAARLQDVLTWGLLALSAVFIAAGLVFGDVANLRPWFGGEGNGGFAGFLAVFMTAPFWFAGFNVIPQAMEEKSEGTALHVVGRVVLLSIGVAGAFYCLVILAASMTQPWQGLLEADLPAAAAFEGAFPFPVLGKLVLVAALLGIITTWNTVFLAGSRVLFALGRGRLIPPAFGTVHPRFGSPATAVLFVGLVGTIGTLLGRNAIVPIVTLVGACFGVGFLLTALALIRLRRTRPRAVRPYRTPGGVWTAALAAAGSVLVLALALWEPFRAAAGIPLEWWVLALWIVLGALLWYAGRARRTAVTEAERRRLVLGAIAGDAAEPAA